MAIALIQQAKVSIDNDNTANRSLTTANFGASVTAGNLIAVFIRAYGGSTSTPITGITSVTDTLGTTYTARIAAGGTNNPGVWFYTGVAGSSGTNAVTAVLNCAANLGVYAYVHASEYSGAGAYDTGSSNSLGSVPSGNCTAGTMNTAGAGIILLGGGLSGAHTLSAGSGFTLEDGAIGTGPWGGVEYQVTATAQTSFTGHISANATWAYTFIQASILASVAATAPFPPWPAPGFLQLGA